MKIPVTGGVSFIGSHVTDRFVADGHEVVGPDNLIIGARRDIPANARFVEPDIRDRKGVDQLLATGRFIVITDAPRDRVNKLVCVSPGWEVCNESKRLPAKESLRHTVGSVREVKRTGHWRR